MSLKYSTGYPKTNKLLKNELYKRLKGRESTILEVAKILEQSGLQLNVKKLKRALSTPNP